MRARFSPERQYLLESARGLVQFVQNGFPVAYKEWHTKEELKELLETTPIYTDEIQPRKITTVAALIKQYEDKFEKRRYGSAHKVQYRLKPEV